MSHRGNYHNNAVAESFIANLMKEKIRRIMYKARSDTRHAIFEFIEVFYKLGRRPTLNNKEVPMVFEQPYFESQ